MNAKTKTSRLILFVVVSIALLSACVGTPAQAPFAGNEVFETSSGFSCPQPNPRVETTSNKLNLFTWTEYIPADIIECFSLVYGIEVNTDLFSSNEELNAKLLQGRDSSAYDLVHPSDYMIDVLIREGLLQKADKSRLPNYKNLDAGLLRAYGDTLDYVVPFQMGTDAIVYNSETVKNPPTSWADLWNPEYEGRIVSVDDSRLVIGIALLTLGYDINTTDEGQLEEAKAKLLELIPNIRVFDSDSPKSALVAGDVDLGIVWNGEAALAQMEDPRFVYVFPKEGTINFYDGLALPTDAPHADAAYAFLNYMMQGDVFWLVMVDYPYTNPNKASLAYAKENQPEVYEAYINSPTTNTPSDVFANGHDVKDVGEALLLYDRIWTEIKGE